MKDFKDLQEARENFISSKIGREMTDDEKFVMAEVLDKVKQQNGEGAELMLWNKFQGAYALMAAHKRNQR